jgi:hypothetical protein
MTRCVTLELWTLLIRSIRHLVSLLLSVSKDGRFQSSAVCCCGSRFSYFFFLFFSRLLPCRSYFLPIAAIFHQLSILFKKLEGKKKKFSRQISCWKELVDEEIDFFPFFDGAPDNFLTKS